jgi:flagellar basal body-associated protein FliL
MSICYADNFFVALDQTNFEMCKGELYSNNILIKNNIDLISFIEIESQKKNVFSWSSFSVYSSYINPKEDLIIYQFFNPSFNLKDGTYKNNFIINTNYGEKFYISQNINLKTCNNMQIDVYQNAYSNCPCSLNLYYFNITNNAKNYADVFYIYSDLPTDYYGISNSQILIAPGDTKNFVLSVMLPCDMNESYEFNLITQSKTTGIIGKTPLFLDIREKCNDFELNIGLHSVIYENQTKFPEFSDYDYNYFEFCKNDTIMIPFEIKNLGEINNSYDVLFEGKDFYNLYYNKNQTIIPNSSAYGSIVFQIHEENLGYYKSNIKVIEQNSLIKKNLLIEMNNYDCDYVEDDKSNFFNRYLFNKFFIYLLFLLLLLLIILFIIYYFFLRKKEEKTEEIIITSKIQKIDDKGKTIKEEKKTDVVVKEDKKQNYFWLIFFIIFIVLLFAGLIIFLFLFYLTPYSSTYYELNQTSSDIDNQSVFRDDDLPLLEPINLNLTINETTKKDYFNDTINNDSLLDNNSIINQKEESSFSKSFNNLINFLLLYWFYFLILIILILIILFFLLFFKKNKDNVKEEKQIKDKKDNNIVGKKIKQKKEKFWSIYNVILLLIIIIILFLVFVIVYYSYFYEKAESQDDEELFFYQENSTNYIWNKNTNKIIDLSEYIIDPNKDELKLSLAEEIENLTVEFDGLKIKITPDKNWYGERNLKLFAENNHGLKTYNDDINLIVLNKEKWYSFANIKSFLSNYLVYVLFLFLIVAICSFLLIFYIKK